MKKLLVSLFFFGLFVNLFAQQANYERAEEVKSYLLPYKYDKVTPFFTEGSDDFWFRELLEDGEKYYYVDLKAIKVEEFLDPAYMAREMENATV